VRGVVRVARGAVSANPSTIAAGGSGVGGGLSIKISALADFAPPDGSSSTAGFTSPKDSFSRTGLASSQDSSSPGGGAGVAGLAKAGRVGRPATDAAPTRARPS
jgi:hypothetical protein